METELIRRKYAYPYGVMPAFVHSVSAKKLLKPQAAEQCVRFCCQRTASILAKVSPTYEGQGADLASAINRSTAGLWGLFSVSRLTIRPNWGSLSEIFTPWVLAT